MSGAMGMQACLLHVLNFNSRLALWVSPVGRDGEPVDPVFLDAAHRVGVHYFLHRARRLNDPSRTIELVERAVHTASRACRTHSVSNPTAYLLRTFASILKAELEIASRFSAISDGGEPRPVRKLTSEAEESICRLIQRREILDLMDPAMQDVFWRLFWGFTITEIADRLGISPNTLSKRIGRTRARLKKALDHVMFRGRPSRVRETSESSPPKPR